MKKLLAVAAILALVFMAFPALLIRAQTSNTQSNGINGFNCVVTVSTATTIQAVGGSCVAPGAALRLYITDVEFGTNAGAIAADAFITLKSGTGGTCGSSTAVVWQGMTAAATQQTLISNRVTPIRLPLNSELCWIDTTAGSKILQVGGYIAP